MYDLGLYSSMHAALFIAE